MCFGLISYYRPQGLAEPGCLPGSVVSTPVAEDASPCELMKIYRATGGLSLWVSLRNRSPTNRKTGARQVGPWKDVVKSTCQRGAESKESVLTPHGVKPERQTKEVCEEQQGSFSPALNINK